MYITIDMLTDPIFWAPLPLVMFFMGGKYSPLSIFKWYRVFWESIGFNPIQSSGDMMDADVVHGPEEYKPCAECSDGQATIYPAVEIHHH